MWFLEIARKALVHTPSTDNQSNPPFRRMTLFALLPTQITSDVPKLIVFAAKNLTKIPEE
jgi:hypothetical protein